MRRRNPRVKIPLGKDRIDMERNGVGVETLKGEWRVGYEMGIKMIKRSLGNRKPETNVKIKFPKYNVFV